MSANVKHEDILATILQLLLKVQLYTFWIQVSLFYQTKMSLIVLLTYR